MRRESLVSDCLARPGLGPLPRTRSAQRPEHGTGRGRTVQRVEVDSRHAGDQELRALLGGVCDSELELAFGIALGAQECGLQPRRNRRVTEVAYPLRLRVARDRDHAGEDRDVDALAASCGDEVE